jgi:hypothetical protein
MPITRREAESLRLRECQGHGLRLLPCRCEVGKLNIDYAEVS